MNNQTGIKRSEEFKRRVSESLKGHKVSDETKKKIGLANSGRKMSENQKKFISFIHKGKKLTSEHIAKIVTKNTGKKRTLEIREKFSKLHKGEKCNFWKGGISPENKRIRMSTEFRLWREAVFAHDNWTCRDCGIRGGELHPHHIKSFSQFPELRFAIDNGVTFCEKCHKKTDNYANRKQPAPVASGGSAGMHLPITK